MSNKIKPISAGTIEAVQQLEDDRWDNGTDWHKIYAEKTKAMLEDVESQIAALSKLRAGLKAALAYHESAVEKNREEKDHE